MGRRLVLIEWQGRTRARRDVMLELWSAGTPVAGIARQLGVPYQTVYIVVRPPAGARPSPDAPDPEVPTASATTADAVVVGCVATKGPAPAPARDLYRSELFRRRRSYAEASGRPWWILSAEHGLVAPDTVIAPYDTRITTLPLDARRRLAASFARDLGLALGTLAGKRIEFHAGDEYLLAVSPELRRRGAVIERPLQGLGIGEQLAWYGRRVTDSLPDAPEPDRREPPAAPADDGRGLARDITDAFMKGALDLSLRAGAPHPGWAGMPEVVAATELRRRGADDVAVRRFLTFCAAMDRARDADRLAVAAVALFRDNAWAFDPAEVASRPVRALAEVLRASGVSQRHSVDLAGWRLIAESLVDPQVAPAARAAVTDGRADARDLLRELVSVSPAGVHAFPLLGGPKVGPLWIRLLAYPGNARISSLAEVPVAVDVQVRKVTEYLGVTDTGGLALDDVRSRIQEVWRKDVAAHGAAGPGDLTDTPAALDPALWFYAKWGCTFCQRAGTRLPIAAPCAACRFPDDGS